MPTPFYAVTCSYLHCKSLRLDKINTPSIRLQHGLLIRFDLRPGVEKKGEMTLLDSLSKKRYCMYCELLPADPLIFNDFALETQ